jgi:branched-chain amino acid transport system ATP-binding protein
MSLEIDHIGRSFGGFQALKAVSLTVETNALVGIIGPNGAGKSTLFSVISGFIAPDEGKVRFEGRDITNLRPETRANAGMVRTFQVPREFSHLSVRENLMAAAPNQTGEGLFGLFFRPGKVRAEEEKLAEKVSEILTFLKLNHVADQPSGKLSGGQKKLLELGRTLMVQPKMILLDEPFAGVNPVLIETIMDRIRELHARGIGFVVIEHDLHALTRLVKRMAVMVQGTVIADGHPNEVLDLPRVREAYLGGAV